MTTAADVVSFMSENLGPEVVTVHVAGHPEITVDGDTATGSWVFEDTVIVPDFKVIIRGGGYYVDDYRKDADGNGGSPARSMNGSTRR